MNLQITNDDIKRKFLLNLKHLIRAGRKSILPPPNMSVSEWADKYRILPETSTEPGKYKTARTPHAKAIMDAFNDPRVRQITVMGSSQIGKTEIINNIVGYIIDINPCAVILMQPTERDAKDYVEYKLDPMIEDTPNLRAKVPKAKKTDSKNTLFRKKFVGGHLLIVWGGSIAALRGKSAKVTIGDDIDALQIGFQKEGDPVLRLIKRSTTYPDHININISTPTIAGSSRIEILYNQSNRQKYYVQCPHCNSWIILLEEYLNWEKKKDLFGKVIEHNLDTVHYVCQECGGIITESDRMDMLRKGEWRAEKPFITYHQGFWMNELSSTLSTMRKIAQAIIDAGDNEEKLEALYNTVYGRVYQKIKGEEVDTTGLMERVEDYINKELLQIPNDVLLLTAAVDVQAGGSKTDARLELAIYGWGKDEECWLIYRQKIPGNIDDLTSEKSPWKILDKFWQMKWYRKDGAQLPIYIKGVDSGFKPMTVYEYTAQRHREGLYAIKGANKYGADLLQKKMSIVNRGRNFLIIIGTQTAKMEIMSRLKNQIEKNADGNYLVNPGPKFIHFAKAFADAEYFKELTSEHLVRKQTGMYDYFVWEKKHKYVANESLDLLVYNYALMKKLVPNWAALENKYKRLLNENKEIVNKTENETIIRKQDPVIVKPKKAAPVIPEYKKNSILNW